MSESIFIERILAWMNRRVAPPGVTIEADTELFAGGLIDSIRILYLIAWTERETGRAIPDERIRMDNFATARRIAQTFAGA
jgi:acyl carrier protein